MKSVELQSVPSPNILFKLEDQLKQGMKDLNQRITQLNAILRSMTGQSGESPQFSADIDLLDNRIINLGDPINKPDATNRRYVDQKDEELKVQIDEINEILHNDLPPIQARSIYLTRALPTTANDIIEIGNFLLTNDGHSLDVAVTVSDSSFSVAKQFFVETQRSINSDWQIVLPLVDSGPGGTNNFDLDVKQVDADSKLYLRLRRTGGSTAGTAIVHIFQRGSANETFNSSEATASVSAPTAYLQNATLSLVDGALVFYTRVPVHTSSGFATLSLSGPTHAAILELIAQDTDADATVLGFLLGTDKNCSQTDKRSAYIALLLQGTTANNRGGRILFATRPDADTVPVDRESIDNQGNHTFAGSVSVGTGAAGNLAVKNGSVPTGSIADQFHLYAKDAAADKSWPTFREEGNTATDRFIVGCSAHVTPGATVRAIHGTDASVNAGWASLTLDDGTVKLFPYWDAA